LKGKVYWFGGFSNDSGNLGYVYDPASGAIGPIPNYPEPSVTACCLGVARESSDEIYGLAGVNGSNDAWDGYYKLGLAEYRDVGVVGITAPAAEVDSGDTITPAAIIENFGSITMGCRTLFRIDSSYSASDSVYLEPGQSDTVRFPVWPATVKGPHTARCSLAVADDQPADDTLTDSFQILVRHDVGVTQIIAPAPNIDSADTIVPTAVVKNFGSVSDGFRVMFRVNGYYLAFESVYVRPGESTHVTFAPWTANIPRWGEPVTCSTMLADDDDSSNNALTRSIFVHVFDAGLNHLSLPDTVVEGDFTPFAYVYNYGTDDLSFWVCWRTFRDDTARVYAQSESAFVPVGASPVVVFPTWPATPGRYLAKVFILYHSQVLGDTISQHFLVVSDGIADSDSGQSRPKAFALDVPAPSPCRDRAFIRYALPHDAEVRLKIYNAAGEVVRTLVDSKQGPGRYNVVWNRDDDRGRRLAAGIYFVRLNSPGFEQTRKVVITR
jgi:hypothetical protein